MIKAVIFDCFGVLAHGNWKDFWTTLPNEELRSEARELHKAYDMGLLPQEEFNKQLAVLTGKPVSKISAIFNDTQPVKNSELLDYIKTLKLKYKIGLLSNVGTSWIEDKLLSPDEQSLFDDMVFSYRVNMAKPDRDIYLLAASRLGVKPNECVLVDDITQYCEAAEELGMKSIIYRSFFDFKNDLTTLLLNN